MSSSPQPAPVPSQGVTWIALLLSLAGSAGSLWLSLGMGLEACALCYYQRSFMLALVGVLFLGLVTGIGKQVALSLLALPLATTGLGVAGFHFWLERSGQLECPKGLFTQGSAPQQSVITFTMLTVMLLADLLTRPGLTRRVKGGGGVVGLLLGAGFAACCILSAAAPPRPAKPYPAGEVNKCRVPYKPPPSKSKSK